MARNRSNKPAVVTTDKTTEPAATPDSAVDATNEAVPAAPAASETGSEQAEAPAVQADAAATSHEPEDSAPPASAEPQQDSELQAKIDEKASATGDAEPTGGETPPAIDPALTDTKQEDLDKQAEEKQPEAPVLDRVLSRLAATHAEPNAGYCSTSPEVRLSGEMAELNAKLFNAMAGEGVVCRGQGDTLQFLLEQLAETFKRAF